MNFNVDELFKFDETDGGYALNKYLKKDDPSVTELKIPNEYNGKPVLKIRHDVAIYAKHIKRVSIPGSVREIGAFAFEYCPSLEEVEFSEGLELIANCAFAHTNLRSVKLPKSLNAMYWGAFSHCEDLERVELNSAPQIELTVFSGCPKLPPETVVMGLVRSADITAPIYNNNDLLRLTENSWDATLDCIRPDVFELLAKNNSFRNCDINHLFKRMAEENKRELFPVAERYGLLESKELVDTLIGYSAELHITELTAYLLDLKNRKFGFNGLKMGDDDEL